MNIGKPIDFDDRHCYNYHIRFNSEPSVRIEQGERMNNNLRINAPESSTHELYSVLLKVLIEVMDYPPRPPFSTESYLPPQFRAEIISTLEKINEANPELPELPRAIHPGCLAEATSA